MQSPLVSVAIQPPNVGLSGMKR